MSNKTSSEDYFAPIFYSSDFSHVSVAVALTSQGLSIIAVLLTLVVNQYDSSINRRSTLLTKFNYDVNWTFVFYTPIQLIDTVRSAESRIFSSNKAVNGRIFHIVDARFSEHQN